MCPCTIRHLWWRSGLRLQLWPVPRKSVLGGRCFLPPWHPEVTPSQWHTGLPQAIRKSLVWQTKYFKCVRAIANHIFNTIFFGDKTMLKVGNRHWYTRIDSKTAAFHSNEKSNQFCSTRPVILSWLWTWIRLISVRAPAWSYAIY